MKKFSLLTVLAVSLSAASVSGFAQSAAITDPPADKAFPAKLDPFLLPSHGATMNAVAYVASGAGPHPAVVLLHGFPGNDKNTDVAQAMRRAGFTVVMFSYRGAWGSGGTFSFANALEDSQAAVDYLRVPENAKRLRVDSDKIVVVGHSMGGWMTLATGAADPKVRAVIAISGGDMAGRTAQAVATMGAEAVTKMGATMMNARVLAPLGGVTAAALSKELLDHLSQWSFQSYAKGLGMRPVFFVTSDDGNAAASDSLAKTLRAAGNKDVHVSHLATDHEYSDKRIALAQIVLDDLAMLKLQ